VNQNRKKSRKIPYKGIFERAIVARGLDWQYNDSQDGSNLSQSENKQKTGFGKVLKIKVTFSNLISYCRVLGLFEQSLQTKHLNRIKMMKNQLNLPFSFINHSKSINP